MKRYRYERGHREYFDESRRRVMERPTTNYRIIDGTFGQIANCHRADDAERIVEALNMRDSAKKLSRALREACS